MSGEASRLSICFIHDTGFVLRVSTLLFGLLLVVQFGSVFSQNAAGYDIDTNAFTQLQSLDAVNNLTTDFKISIDEIKSELADLKNAVVKLAMFVARAETDNLNQAKSSAKMGAASMPLPRDCADIMAIGMKTSGLYKVYIGRARRAVNIYCDMNTDGGGWLVFQRRKDGSVSLERDWSAYADGFGNLEGEFWIGNSNLHTLTAGGNYELRVDLKDWNGSSAYALYNNFKVASACEKYKLTSVGTYCGTAGDSMTSHVGQSFSTRDQDNDAYARSCAVEFKGAWWYGACHTSNLNGLYIPGGSHTSYADGVEWFHWTGHYYSLQFTEMKIRPEAPEGF